MCRIAAPGRPTRLGHRLGLAGVARRPLSPAIVLPLTQESKPCAKTQNRPSCGAVGAAVPGAVCADRREDAQAHLTTVLGLQQSTRIRIMRSHTLIGRAAQRGPEAAHTADPPRSLVGVSTTHSSPRADDHVCGEKSGVMRLASRRERLGGTRQRCCRREGVRSSTRDDPRKGRPTGRAFQSDDALGAVLARLCQTWRLDSCTVRPLQDMARPAGRR